MTHKWIYALRSLQVNSTKTRNIGILRYSSGIVRVALSAIVASLFLASGVAQGASEPPAVIDESASQVGSSGATLEATLDPGSALAGAYYQFQLSEFPTEFPDELNCPTPENPGPFLPCSGPEAAGALPIGQIAHGDGSAPVALDLADAGVTLEPGTTYYFRVVVAAAVGSEDTIEWEDPVMVGGGRSFTTTGSSSPQLVTSESASRVTATNATLEASIDSAGPAYYQFQLSELPTEFPDELNCPPPPVFGLPACVGPQSDTALPIGYSGGSGNLAQNLAEAGVTLKPGTTYYFRVLVAPAKQTEDSVEWEKPVVTGEVRTFATPTTTSGPAGSAAGAGAVAPTAGPPPAGDRPPHPPPPPPAPAPAPAPPPR